MGRPRKKQEALNCRLDKDVYDLLSGYALVSGMTKTAVVEKAIIEYIDHRNTEKAILRSYEFRHNNQVIHDDINDRG